MIFEPHTEVVVQSILKYDTVFLTDLQKAFHTKQYLDSVAQQYM